MINYFYVFIIFKILIFFFYKLVTLGNKKKLIKKSNFNLEEELEYIYTYDIN